MQVKPVAVADTESTYTDSHGNQRYRVLRRFDTTTEAKSWVGKQRDKAKVERGAYEISDRRENK